MPRRVPFQHGVQGIEMAGRSRHLARNHRFQDRRHEVHYRPAGPGHGAEQIARRLHGPQDLFRQQHVERPLDPGHQSQCIGAGSLPAVDEEVGVLAGDLDAANPLSLEAGLINEAPCEVALGLQVDRAAGR